MMDLDTEANDPALAGQFASHAIIFGAWSRYKVQAVHTRFDAVSFFVFDGEDRDPVTNSPAVIRQEATQALAVAGLRGS